MEFNHQVAVLKRYISQRGYIVVFTSIFDGFNSSLFCGRWCISIQEEPRPPLPPLMPRGHPCRVSTNTSAINVSWTSPAIPWWVGYVSLRHCQSYFGSILFILFTRMRLSGHPYPVNDSFCYQVFLTCDDIYIYICPSRWGLSGQPVLLWRRS